MADICVYHSIPPGSGMEKKMLLEKYLPRTEFDSYEDFKKNYKVNVPENFNFGFDIVDE